MKGASTSPRCEQQGRSFVPRGRMSLAAAPRLPRRWNVRTAATSQPNLSTKDISTAFPASYDQAMRQAQEACKAALADGHKLLEVEFPSSGLAGVQGDGEGQNEMNESMKRLRQWLVAFRDQADTIRVFWPDAQELAVAMNGQDENKGSGRTALEPIFDGTSVRMGFLTKQSAIWSALGVNLGFGGERFSPVQQVQDSDKLFIAAYPHFNPREEMGAVLELYQQVAQPRGIPIVTWNAELDRLRGGYYPGFAFAELAAITRELVPKFTQAYYIHNFKGRQPGVLFRAYPGPWCVFRRGLKDPEQLRLIWTSDTMPSLKQVALELLPSNL